MVDCTKLLRTVWVVVWPVPTWLLLVCVGAELELPFGMRPLLPVGSVLLVWTGPLLLLPLLARCPPLPLLVVLLLGAGPELLCRPGPLLLPLSVGRQSALRSPDAVWLAVSVTAADACTSISRRRQGPVAAAAVGGSDPAAPAEPGPGPAADRPRVMPRMSETSGARRGRERVPRSAPRAPAAP